MSDKNQASLATVTQSIVNDCFVSIMHNLVLQIHASEMALVRAADTKTGLPICPTCSLPRLVDPPLASSRPEKSTQYCSHVPWSRKAGHDIYGNPFPVAGADRPPTKKEREARAAQAKKKDGAPGKGKTSGNGGGDDEDGENNGEGPNIAGGPVDKKAAKVGERLKGGTYVPWHTCPSCKRSLLITRFAQHLEKCLGIGGRGRAAAAAAAAARNGNGSTNSQGSGAGAGHSRGGTPTGKDRATKDDSDDEDDKAVGGGGGGGGAGDDAMRKKVLKKGLKKDAGKLSAVKDGIKISKMLSGSIKGEGGSGGGGGGGSAALGAGSNNSKESKRERENDDEDDVTPMRKKLKLQRTHSLVSAASISVDNEGSVIGDESIDGSFVHNDDEEASEED